MTFVDFYIQLLKQNIAQMYNNESYMSRYNWNENSNRI